MLNQIDPPHTFQGKKEGIELQLDWTDDFKDPRTGLRLKSTYDLNTSEAADSPEYYLTSHGLNFISPFSEKVSGLSISSARTRRFEKRATPI